MSKTADADHNCTGKDCRAAGCDSAALSQSLAAQPARSCETCGKRPGKKAGYCSPCFDKKRAAQWAYAEGHHYASEGRR